MSAQELEALAAEAASITWARAESANTAEPAGEGPPPEDEPGPTADSGDGCPGTTAERGDGSSSASAIGEAELSQALAALIGLAGGLVCARYGVSPLTPEEAGQLGAASGRVAVLYDVQMSDKAAAWLGLGLVAVAVVGPRVVEYRRLHEPPPAPVEPDPAPGDTGDDGDDGRDGWPMPGPELDGAV